ncbi:hypothetical protein GPN2_12904 [Streptomyces murinus]
MRRRRSRPLFYPQAPGLSHLLADVTQRFGIFDAQ